MMNAGGVKCDVLEFSWLYRIVPAGQPGHSVVVLDFLPLSTCRRVRTFGVLAAVDDDVLRQYPSLDHSLLGVLASTSE